MTSSRATSQAVSSEPERGSDMGPSKDDRSERPSAIPRAGRPWRWAVLGVASICVVLAVVGYVVVSARATDRGAVTLNAAESTPEWRGPDSELGTRGTAELDGVRLTAGEIQCGLPTQDWKGGTARAAGQFCVVDIELSNTSEAPLALAPTGFELRDAAGSSALAGEDVTAYGTGLPAGPPSSMVLPVGAGTRIHLVFDMPAAASGPMVLRFTPTPELTITL